MKIFKYKINKLGQNVIDLPRGAQLVSMVEQGDLDSEYYGIYGYWMIPEGNLPLYRHYYWIIDTGMNFPDGLSFICTGEFRGGRYQHLLYSHSVKLEGDDIGQ